MSSTQYLHEVLKNVEKYQGHPFVKKEVQTPTASDFHPELDTSELLGDADHSYYQSLIGILQWLIELGRVDIHFATSCMSKFSASPRVNHLKYVRRIFAYLKYHDRSRLVFDYRPRNWDGLHWAVHDWTDYYPDAIEHVPHNMPPPLGIELQVNFWCDASFATDLSTRRSQTGIIIFIGNAPLRWFSKRQTTTEGSAYAAESNALKQAGEQIEALRFKLRMMGIPVKAPANGFVDNQAVVFNSTIPTSVLRKKHNSIAYHKIRELVATGVLRLHHEPGEYNLADLLTKGVNGPRNKFLLRRILH
jgi:hypothetical protein